jgi:hypothetical protein
MSIVESNLSYNLFIFQCRIYTLLKKMNETLQSNIPWLWVIKTVLFTFIGYNYYLRSPDDLGNFPSSATAKIQERQTTYERQDARRLQWTPGRNDRS